MASTTASAKEIYYDVWVCTVYTVCCSFIYNITMLDFPPSCTYVYDSLWKARENTSDQDIKLSEWDPGLGENTELKGVLNFTVKSSNVSFSNLMLS